MNYSITIVLNEEEKDALSKLSQQRQRRRSRFHFLDNMTRTTALPYYIRHDKLVYYQVNVPCPGCGKIDCKQLSIHCEFSEYQLKRIYRFYVGCLCGWCGPYGATPEEAIHKWDTRTLRSE